MRVVAISGSLRAVSSNTTLLRAAVILAPGGVKVILYEGIETLPHFNPDNDTDDPPPAVADFRARLAEADGVLISSPEYAHGVAGSLKNALDWDVSHGALYRKPVALLNASPRAHIAQAALKETLQTMGANIVADIALSVPLRGENDAAKVADDPEIVRVLQAALDALVRAAKESANPETAP